MYCRIWNLAKHSNREHVNVGSSAFVHMALARRLLCGYFDEAHDVNIVSCVLKKTFGWRRKSRMQTCYSYIYMFYMHVARNSFHLWNSQMVMWISKCHHSPSPQIGVCYMRFSLRVLHTGCLENHLGVAFLFVGFIEISNFVFVRTLLIANSMSL